MESIPRYSFRCGNCYLPIEFCDFTYDYDNCKKWLDNKFRKLMPKLASSITSAKQKRGTRKASDPRKVKVSKTMVGGKTCTTIVGLQQYGVDLDYACLLLSSVFGKGVRVTAPDTITTSEDLLFMRVMQVVPYYWPDIHPDCILYERKSTKEPE